MFLFATPYAQNLMSHWRIRPKKPGNFNGSWVCGWGCSAWTLQSHPVMKLFVESCVRRTFQKDPELQEATAGSCEKLGESKWKISLPPQSHNWQKWAETPWAVAWSLLEKCPLPLPCLVLHCSVSCGMMMPRHTLTPDIPYNSLGWKGIFNTI